MSLLLWILSRWYHNPWILKSYTMTYWRGNIFESYPSWLTGGTLFVVSYEDTLILPHQLEDIFFITPSFKLGNNVCNPSWICNDHYKIYKSLLSYRGYDSLLSVTRNITHSFPLKRYDSLLTSRRYESLLLLLRDILTLV